MVASAAHAAAIPAESFDAAAIGAGAMRGGVVLVAGFAVWPSGRPGHDLADVAAACTRVLGVLEQRAQRGVEDLRRRQDRDRKCCRLQSGSDSNCDTTASDRSSAGRPRGGSASIANVAVHRKGDPIVPAQRLPARTAPGDGLASRSRSHSSPPVAAVADPLSLKWDQRWMPQHRGKAGGGSRCNPIRRSPSIRGSRAPSPALLVRSVARPQVGRTERSDCGRAEPWRRTGCRCPSLLIEVSAVVWSQ